MGRRLQVAQGRAAQGAPLFSRATFSHPLRYIAPSLFSRPPRPPATLPFPRLLESTRPALSLRHSLEASRGEDEQLWGEESCGTWAGGGWTLLRAISACLQLREPVSEPPISTVARGWMEMGRDRMQRLICLALPKQPHCQPSAEPSLLCTPPWASASYQEPWSFLLYMFLDLSPFSSVDHVTNFVEWNLSGWQMKKVTMETSCGGAHL